jgi:putative acetyltransferase
MITCIRTDSENPDFKKLVIELDAALKIVDGEDHAFYSQYNKIDKIQCVVVAYENEIPIGCGAIKEYTKDTVEIKRMYVPLNKRGQGIATVVLKELEDWARELGNTKCILETGKRQPDAIGLYTKNGYTQIPNYGQYENIDNSVCYEKALNVSLINGNKLKEE